MIVCVCKGLSSREIERYLRLDGDSLEELLRRTGAGMVCGACLPMLQEIAESAGREPSEPDRDLGPNGAD
jgi:bacterioferritin-associated ferredoxin